MRELAGSAGAKSIFGEAWISLVVKLCGCVSAALNPSCLTRCSAPVVRLHLDLEQARFVRGSHVEPSIVSFTTNSQPHAHTPQPASWFHLRAGPPEGTAEGGGVCTLWPEARVAQDWAGRYNPSSEVNSSTAGLQRCSWERALLPGAREHFPARPAPVPGLGSCFGGT